MADKIGISYLIFKRLKKLDLDVLTDADASKTNEHIPFSRKLRPDFDELTGHALRWRTEGQSEWADMDIAGVPGKTKYRPKQIPIQVQGGVRGGEIKLPRQRPDPLRVWSDPVKKKRPPEDEAFIFLVRDADGAVHARYVEDEIRLPRELRNRIRALNAAQGGINFADEGGVILENQFLGRVLQALRAAQNVILFGPPGTGKTWLMREAQRAFEKGIRSIFFDPGDLNEPFKAESWQPVTDRSHRSSRFLTFHQSTSYESFVCGLTAEIAADGKLSYTVRAGPFLESCESALAPDSASLLLIDEINRGNTAQIFGELITVIELDKRLDENGNDVPFETVKPRLPYYPDPTRWKVITSEGELRMPRPLYILASMNSVDRTVAPLDSALRRRFQIIEVPPDMALLRQKLSEVLDDTPPAEEDEWRRLFLVCYRLLERINLLIAVLRGPDFRLGHAYVWSVFAPALSVAERRRELFRVVSDVIVPQVSELFRDEPDALFTLLGGEANRNRFFLRHAGEEVQPSIGYAPGWIETQPFPVENPDLGMAILRAMAGVEQDELWGREEEPGIQDATSAGLVTNELEEPGQSEAATEPAAPEAPQ